MNNIFPALRTETCASAMKRHAHLLKPVLLQSIQANQSSGFRSAAFKGGDSAGVMPGIFPFSQLLSMRFR
jgi:hypothetical protein